MTPQQPGVPVGKVNGPGSEADRGLDPPRRRGNVLAVVVTHSSPEHVRSCLAALAAQSAGCPDVLIVDVASSPPVPSALSVAGVQNLQVMRLDENCGPAGGFAAGISEFMTTKHEFVWLFDDDSRADPHALEHLREAMGRTRGEQVVQPRVLDADQGDEVAGLGWCGFLISRGLVARMGLPLAELVYWAEDSEYVIRSRDVGDGIYRESSAVVHVARQRSAPVRPRWKYYYSTRNSMWARKAGMRHVVSQKEISLRAMRDLRHNAWRAVRPVLYFTYLIVWRDRTDVCGKLAIVYRGAWDGWRGRLGLRVPLDSPDRPSTDNHLAGRSDR